LVEAVPGKRTPHVEHVRRHQIRGFMASQHADGEDICHIKDFLRDIGAEVSQYLSLRIFFLPLLSVFMSVVLPFFKLLNHGPLLLLK
jgi:hypothetical protein